MSNINTLVEVQEKLMNTYTAQTNFLNSIDKSEFSKGMKRVEEIMQSIDYEKLNGAVGSLTQTAMTASITMQRALEAVPYEEINNIQRTVYNMNINYIIPSVEALTETMVDYGSVIMNIQNQLDNLSKENFDTEEDDTSPIITHPELTIDISNINYSEMAKDIEITKQQVKEIQYNESSIEDLEIKETFLEKIAKNFNLEPETLKKELKSYGIEKIFDWSLKIIWEVIKYFFIKIFPIFLFSTGLNYIYNVNINIHIGIEEISEASVNQSNRHYINKKIDYLENNLLLNEANNQIRILTRDNYIYKFKKRNAWPVARATTGDIMLELEKDRNWTKVGYQNEDTSEYVEGWVFSRYLEKISK